jgi:LuxR family quorum-sensing system transcriptional regulator CciR
MSRSTVRLKQILVGRSQADLEAATLQAARNLGFRYLVFSGALCAGNARSEFRFDNLPAQWRRHCATRGRDLLPGSLRRLALEEVTPLLWCQVAPEGGRSFAAARQCGLATGVSCSVRGPQGQWSLTSFVLARGGAAAERHIASVLPDCQLIACAIHHAAARIAARKAGHGAPRLGNGLLSERESQCLLESARGRKASEIAEVLQISERTVAFHLANMRRKLDAANSRHAVTKAFSLRLITAG